MDERHILEPPATVAVIMFNPTVDMTYTVPTLTEDQTAHTQFELMKVDR